MNSFHSFYPDIGVVLNIDDDHTDCFPHISDAVESFSEFLSHCSGAVLNLDCQNVMQAAHGFCGEILTFSAEDRHADIYAAQCSWQYGRPSFVLRYRGQDLGRISLSVPGAFNISNALAAAGAAIMHGISPQAICFGLSSCRGCRRRMEYRGCHMGVAYYDDYAHHPAEVASSLAAVRMFTSGRIICVFQAHTYSRVAAHLAAFGEALRLADIVVVSDIYAARESDTLNMSAQVMADCIGDTARAISCDTEIAEYITSAASAGDTVIIMGAGDIDRLFDLLSVQ